MGFKILKCFVRFSPEQSTLALENGTKIVQTVSIGALKKGQSEFHNVTVEVAVAGESRAAFT
jgi:hypothetical protein